MKSCLLLIALLLTSICNVLAQSASPTVAEVLSRPVANPAYWKPDQIKWDKTFADGTKLAILEGPRDVPGKAFSYAFFMPDGVWIKPHWHCADARVFVVKGTLLLGFQAEFDKTKVVEMTAGDYFLAPFRYPHYEGSRGETIIIGTGIGPWCTNNLD